MNCVVVGVNHLVFGVNCIESGMNRNRNRVFEVNRVTAVMNCIAVGVKSFLVWVNRVMIEMNCVTIGVIASDVNFDKTVSYLYCVVIDLYLVGMFDITFTSIHSCNTHRYRVAIPGGTFDT